MAPDKAPGTDPGLASGPSISRRAFVRSAAAAAAGAGVLGRAPAVLGQAVKELQVWHTEVDPRSVKVIDEIIAEFEKAHPGVRIKQQALGWGDLNTKLLAAIAAGSPPDLTHLNPFVTASLHVKGLLRPMDELVRHLGEQNIHEATRKLQYFDGKYYGVTHAMGGTFYAYRADLLQKKGLKVPQTFDEILQVVAALTEDTPSGKRYGVQMANEKLYMGFVHPGEALASNGGSWVDPKTWRPRLNDKPMLDVLEFFQKLAKSMPPGWSGQKYLDTLTNLSTDKVAMVWLSGARTIGYIERYAPEGMRDPDHFQPMAKVRGPAGAKGIAAMDGENWAIFSQSKHPEEAIEFLKLFYKRENYIRYCHTVPIHLTPVLTPILNDPEYLAHPTIKKWRSWHDFMVRTLQEARYLPIGFTRPEDNLLPFLAELDGSGIVADLVSGVMAGGRPVKEEADRAQRRAEELLAQLGFKRWA
jgi:multiple sugar transport system substrate-binding protein